MNGCSSHGETWWDRVSEVGSGQSSDSPQRPNVVQHQHRGCAKQRVAMASFNHERVGHALDELLQRIVPDDPNDTEEEAEQRLQDAYDRSMQQLIGAGEPKAVPDVNHIASLLEAKSKQTWRISYNYSWLTPQQSVDLIQTSTKSPACTTCSDDSRTSQY